MPDLAAAGTKAEMEKTASAAATSAVVATQSHTLVFLQDSPGDAGRATALLRAQVLNFRFPVACSLDVLIQWQPCT